MVVAGQRQFLGDDAGAVEQVPVVAGRPLHEQEGIPLVAARLVAVLQIEHAPAAEHPGGDVPADALDIGRAISTPDARQQLRSRMKSSWLSPRSGCPEPGSAPGRGPPASGGAPSKEVLTSPFRMVWIVASSCDGVRRSV